MTLAFFVCAPILPVSAEAIAPALEAKTSPADAPGKDPKAAPQAADTGSRDATARKGLPKDRRTQLEGYFAALKVAPDDQSSKVIADRLDQLFNDSGSPAVDLLMARANAAAEAKEVELALKLLDEVIAIDPDYLGARAKRATLYYMKDDYAPALADIREALAREPRQFAMLYGFALILKEMDQEKLALEVVRKALEVNPRLEGAKEMEETLSVAVEGREI